MILAGAVGCESSNGGPPPSKAATAQTPSQPTATASSGPAAALPTAATVIAFSVPGPDTGGRDDYRLTVRGLYRDGPYARLDLSVRCDGATSSTCLAETQFAEVSKYNSLSGVRLVDPVAAKEYAVVRDGTDRPFTSAIGPFLDPGEEADAWATFAAPPAGTRSLDVVFPNGGPTLTGVPVTDLPSGYRLKAAGAPFDRPAESTDTVGLTLPVYDVKLRTLALDGALAGTESGGRATLTLRADVLFAFNKADLTPAAQQVIAVAAARMRAGVTGPVTITGYTDSIGSDAYNLVLSRNRATAVLAALQPQLAGLPVTLSARGLGEADPVAPNTLPGGADNPAGRAANRRVTVSYQLPPPPQPSSAPASPSSPSAATAGHTEPKVSFRRAGGVTSTYDVVVDGLHRDGSFAVLDVTITCRSGTNNMCNTETDFAEGTEGYNSGQGFSLLDPNARVRYLTALALEPKSEEVVGAEVPRSSISRDATFRLTVFLAAPPKDVRSIDVVLPNGGPTVSNVPLN